MSIRKCRVCTETFSGKEAVCPGCGTKRGHTRCDVCLETELPGNLMGMLHIDPPREPDDEVPRYKEPYRDMGYWYCSNDCMADLVQLWAWVFDRCDDDDDRLGPDDWGHQ